MNKQIFVNLAVKDLDKSKAFFEALGYTFNPQFTNESGACMVIADGSIYAMLLTEPFFKTFVDKPIVQANVRELRDTTHGMVRTEVRSNGGDSHLGHVFEDGP